MHMLVNKHKLCEEGHLKPWFALLSFKSIYMLMFLHQKGKTQQKLDIILHIS